MRRSPTSRPRRCIRRTVEKLTARGLAAQRRLRLGSPDGFRRDSAGVQLRGSTRTSMAVRAGAAARISRSSSRTAYRSRAAQAAVSAKITSVPARSVTPETLAWSGGGRWVDNQQFQKFCRAACAVTRVKAGTRRASNSFTECAGAEMRPVLLLIGDFPRLFRLIFFGILLGNCLSKPAERRGRKATGLKRGAMTAGLPASAGRYKQNRARLSGCAPTRPEERRLPGDIIRWVSGA